jgi:hypothetical protein
MKFFEKIRIIDESTASVPAENYLGRVKFRLRPFFIGGICLRKR